MRILAYAAIAASIALMPVSGQAETTKKIHRIHRIHTPVAWRGAQDSARPYGGPAPVQQLYQSPYGDANSPNGAYSAGENAEGRTGGGRG
jgi:hypothetical protein